jgi:PAS domain S-box-containing protein
LINTMDQLTEQYSAALEDFLAGAGEAALHFAYELGRKAITDGVGVLEMAAIHNKALTAVFRAPLSREQAVKMAERASAFFAESLAPFEMALRGVQEANAALRANVKQIQAAEEELQRQNQELADAQQSSEVERRRYQELFEFAPDSYLVTDLDGIIQEANRPAAALLQVSPDLLVAQSLPQFVAAEERDSLHAELGWLRRGRLPKLTLWQMTIQRPDGGRIPVILTVGVVRDSQGNLVGLRWLLRDATERKQIEEEKAQIRIREHLVRAESEAIRHLKFLAVASTALAGSLDYASIPDSIASLSVPHLGDCCFVFLIDDSLAIQHFAAEHGDEEKAALVKKLQFHLPGAELPPPVAEMLRSKKPEIIPEISPAWLETFACGSENFTILRQMNFTSAMLVALIAGGRPVGALVCFVAESSRHYTPDDLALADELAHRCALILENARLYQQVVMEKEKAEKASKTKDEFVSILSHELRTPLMTVLGWARILSRQPQISEDQVLKEGVRTLEHNAQNISRLVEDCLDIARVSQGKIQLQKEYVDLNQVANDSFEATGEAAGAKGLKFVARLSRNLYVWGDKARLEEVLLNLLTNAIKFTERGGEVSLFLRRTGNEAEIEVRDNGIGIEPDFLEQVFQPFRQGTTDWLASQSGLGIGLAIVREIVQMHGGHVWAESPGRGCGSLFRLRLPLAEPPSQQKRVDLGEKPSSSNVKPLRILFIEDSRDTLNLMKMELERVGYSVLIAADGESGLEIAGRELPEVIISDIKMPGMDGYELIKQIRRIPQLAGTPAIALTGFGMETDIEKALQAGYNAHLCKPVELDELAALIRKLASAQGKSN